GLGDYWAFYIPDNGGNCTDPPSSKVTVKLASKGCPTDIAITKEVDNGTPIPGENVIFTLTVQNLGTTATGGDATNITVTDVLPSGYTFVTANPSAEYNAGTGVWTIGDLAGGATSELKITATVSTNSTANFTNTATVNVPDNTDTNPDNNTDEETTSP